MFCLLLEEMQDCCIPDDLMYHFIIKSNKMKEPNEVKHMQERIGQVYKNRKVKKNYKNIDVLPTVYDEDKKVGKEGFIFSKKTFNPFKEWKAPYVGPPKKGHIKSVNNKESNEVLNVIEKAEKLLTFFSDNEENLDSTFKFKKKKKLRGLPSFKDMMKPFSGCPCVKIFPIKPFHFSYWHQYVAFFTDTIPCLIEGYCIMLINVFSEDNDYVNTLDKDNIRTAVIEFFYIMISFYIATLLFYYTIIDTSNLINPVEIFPKSGNDAFDNFILNRIIEYMTFPIKIFNWFFETVLPTAAKWMGISPYPKINYMLLLMFSLFLVFNQVIETFADMVKSSFVFKASVLVYASIALAVFMKAIDLDIIYNVKENMTYLNNPITVTGLVIILTLIAFILAPFSQFLLVMYIFNLFFIKPLMNLFTELSITKVFLFDPNNGLSCGVGSSEFFIELDRIISKYIFPYLYSLLLLIFFVYRLYMSTSLNNKAIRTIMYIINFTCIIGIIFSFILNTYQFESMDRNVNIDIDVRPNKSVGKTNYSELINNESNNNAIKLNMNIPTTSTHIVNKPSIINNETQSNAAITNSIGVNKI